VLSPFVTEFMSVEFNYAEFRDLAESGRHLGAVRTTLSRQPGWRASAAGLAPNLSQLMNSAPVHDIVTDVSSSASEPVTSVEHMDDDDDDDRPPGEVLSSDSSYILEPSHSAPGHASQPTRIR
jgi:hypothetical protein